MNYIGRTPEHEQREQEQSNEQITKTLSYPFTDSTMKERRNVLAAALLGILVSYVGIVPTSLPIFGVDFAANEQQNLLILLALIVIYYFISFYVRAFADLSAMILMDIEDGKEKWTTPTAKAVAATFSVRLIMDVGVPLLTAVAALIGLGVELFTLTDGAALP